MIRPHETIDGASPGQGGAVSIEHFPRHRKGHQKMANPSLSGKDHWSSDCPTCPASGR